MKVIRLKNTKLLMRHVDYSYAIFNMRAISETLEVVWESGKDGRILNAASKADQIFELKMLRIFFGGKHNNPGWPWKK